MRLAVFLTIMIAVFAAQTCGAAAQEFAIEDTDLSPVGKTVAAAVHADAGWRKCADCQKCGLVGKAVDLDKSGAKDSTFVTMAAACGCQGGVCPIWIVRGAKVLLSDSGASMIVGRAPRNGLLDVVTDSSTAGRDEIRHFEFDGTKYAPVPMSLGER